MTHTLLPEGIRKLAIGAAVCGFAPAAALAQTSGAVTAPSHPFSSVEKSDLARAWIDYLFRGDTLPDAMASYAAPLSFAADGLRQALGLYSVGMLVLAAILVFYHLAAMVAETAHTGIPFGRRANQLWMPIRFVVAIALLVPVGSSLNSGQYLVLKIAEEGSTLASNAWRMVASTASGHLAGLVTPRGPDVAHLVAAAVEMETCRAIYQQIYTPLDTDTVIHLAGNITDVTKLPADRFMTETWRYTNLINAGVPLCGEYRFPGYRRPFFGGHLPSTAIARIADDLSTFAHNQADELQTQARTIGDRNGAAFVSPAAPIGADVHSDIASLQSTLTSRFNAKRADIGTAGSDLADQTLNDSVEAGWLAAASFIPEFVRLQDSYSEMIDHALPTAQSPVFAHSKMAQKVLKDAIANNPAFIPLEGATPQKLIGLYGQVSRIVTGMHLWLYNTQLADKDFVAPAGADLYDRLNEATDPDAMNDFYTQALDASAFTSGVWGGDPEVPDTGYPFSAVPSSVSYNPFAALVEFGRRQTELASQLAGLAGLGLSQPGATGPAILFGIASFCFYTGGILLVFVVPLLPFLRFLLAALAWIVNVFEAVIAMPIVAIAHINPAGSGLSGGAARQAYMLWLALLVRPILTLFGFVFGLLVFALSIAFLDAVLTPFARLAMPSNSGMLAGANTGLVLFYDVLAYAAANASFKGIQWLPEQALRWTSNFVVTDIADAPAAISMPSLSSPSSVTASSASSTIANITGGTSVNVTAPGATVVTGSGGAASGTERYNMKMQLFPSDTGSSNANAVTPHSGALAPSATHFADHSTGAKDNVQVNVSTSVNTITAAARRDREMRLGPQSRLKGGEHEATIGGKERGSEAPKEPPKEVLPPAPPVPKNEPPTE